MLAPTSLKMVLLPLLFPQLYLTWAAALAPRQQVSCAYETTANSGDTCQSFSAEWGLTLQAFESLNPGITCPNLVAGREYCVGGTVPSSAQTTSSSSMSTSSSSSVPDQPQQTGTAANCDKFYLVQTGDSCEKIENQFDITASEFLAWNPSINSGTVLHCVETEAHH